MSDQTHHELALALAAFAHPRTPGRIAALLRSGGTDALETNFLSLDERTRTDVLSETARLHDSGIRACFAGHSPYPRKLVELKTSIPILLYRGNEALFTGQGVGMCGSRAVSERGIRAATACGEEVARSQLAVVSGYAKGVDMATHMAALTAGGRTVMVLAEGIDRFRIKKEMPTDIFDTGQVLVVSQFSPRQPWSAGAAMARNHVIFGMAEALVVVEAGDKGGTLAAGKAALGAGRPVLVLHFNGSTPPGNRLLIEKGGVPIGTPGELRAAMAHIAGTQGSDSSQLSIF